MAKGAGATVDVDLVVGQVKVFHGRQGDHGKGLVDLEQVDVGQVPAGAFHQLVDGADRRGREQRRGVGEGRVAMDDCQCFKAALFGFGATHQYQRRSAVGN
ncbi:hypothetical protein D3C81_2002210 [compost metagenome]